MKKEKYNVYLDDCRNTPNGFDIRTYTYEDTIQVLEKMEGHIGVLSLDNDLGTEKEGRHVMLWMEEKFYTDDGYILPDKIIVHSMNPIAKKQMEDIIEILYKEQKYDREIN
jgi:hypothetical protein